MELNDKIKKIILAILALLAVVSLVQGVRNAIRDSQDFQWDAAKVLSMGINPYDESLQPSGALDEFGYDKYYLQMEANQFPSLLMILFPFTVLSPLAGRYVWILVNILLTVGMIWLLRYTFLKDMDNVDFAILMCLMIAGTPYRNQIGVGQHTIFAFTFFQLAVYFSEYCSVLQNDNKRNKILRLIIVSLCLFICYFKYTLTVPLVLYFVYKKKYAEIILSGIYHIILTFVAALMLNDSFINMIIKPLKVSSALSSEGGIDFGVFLDGSKTAYILLLMVMLILLFIALRLDEGYDKAFISVLVMWSVIVTYHRTYDFFVIVLAVALFYNLPDSVKDNKKLLSMLRVMFYCMFAVVYFVLRVFSEAYPSKVFAAVIYYTLTLFVTYILIREMYNNKRKI